MTMSASTVESSAFSPLFSTAVLKSSGFRPAAVRAAAAASLMASEVMVAPVTPSTAMLPVSAIWPGSWSSARVPMPWVSSTPSAVQPVILLSVRVRVTVTSPPMPLAVPVKSPDTPAEEAELLLPPQPIRLRAMTDASASAAMRFLFGKYPSFFCSRKFVVSNIYQHKKGTAHSEGSPLCRTK